MGVNIIPEKDANGNIININAPFASKYTKSGQLFKKIHGVKADVPVDGQGVLDFVIPYAICLFAGAEIFGNQLGDQLSFYLLDDDNNTYSGMDVATYGPNVPLMQFGHDLYVPNGTYANTSDYDAELYVGMILRAVYQDNNSTAKTIYMNPEIHEVVTP